MAETNDELAWTALRHILHQVVLNQIVAHGCSAHESAKPVEAAHFREAFKALVVSLVFGQAKALVKRIEGNDALAVLERQQEVVATSLDCLELGGGEVRFCEWKLNVCECQLAKTWRRKHAERGEFVVAEHG